MFDGIVGIYGFFRKIQKNEIYDISIETVIYYSISCSNDLKTSSSKNSISEISSPSHIILIVVMPGFLLTPYIIFFIVDGGMVERCKEKCFKNQPIYILWESI